MNIFYSILLLKSYIICTITIGEVNTTMNEITNLAPFDHFRALDGYHCQTNSFAKIYDFYNSPLSEDMLLGVG
jgi:hypothetical protein